MKKHIIAWSLVGMLAFCMGLGADASTSRTIKADVQAIRIPAGTNMKLELLSPISTKVASVGDEFTAMLKEDKFVNGQIALPAGTVVRGTFDKIVPPRRLSRSAVLYVTFDHVVTPTGRQIPVNAGLYNYPEITLDGGIYQNGNYGYAIKQNWENAKKIVRTTINWGKGTGENMQYVCVPIGAFGGVVGGAFYYVGDDIVDLFKKGNDVMLPQGKELEVMLTQPLDIPLH